MDVGRANVRWRIFVDYLASTPPENFNATDLGQRLLTFEEGWQVGKWGINEGEAWSASGNLLDILGNIEAKWGKLL